MNECKVGPEEENDQEIKRLENEAENGSEAPQAVHDITREPSFWDTAELS